MVSRLQRWQLHWQQKYARVETLIAAYYYLHQDFSACVREKMFEQNEKKTSARLSWSIEQGKEKLRRNANDQFLNTTDLRVNNNGSDLHGVG